MENPWRTSEWSASSAALPHPFSRTRRGRKVRSGTTTFPSQQSEQPEFMACEAVIRRLISAAQVFTHLVTKSHQNRSTKLSRSDAQTSTTE